MRMFKYKGECGQDASVDIYRILGFGHQWATEPPKDVTNCCAIATMLTDGVMNCASSESFEALLARYEDQFREIDRVELARGTP